MSFYDHDMKLNLTNFSRWPARWRASRVGQFTRRMLLTLLAYMMLSASGWSVAVATEIGEVTHPDVLIINSYHSGYPWSDAEQEGILAGLKRGDKPPRVIIEYLDTNNHPDPEYLAIYSEILAYKYAARRPQVVIAMDNAALTFVLDRRKALFPSIPVVFCGINEYSDALIRGHRDVTGVAQDTDPAGALDVMLAIHPNAKTIWVINDYTVTGVAFRAEIERLAAQYADRISILFNDNLLFDELVRQVSALPTDSLVLLQSYATDQTGMVLDWRQVTQTLTRESSVPVYGIHEERLGLGIVGGKLLSGYRHGLDTAAITLRVLSGEKAGSIPVIRQSGITTVFDNRQLERHNIPLSSLPAGSMVINQPRSFFSVHQNVIWVSGGIIAYLLIAIIFLSFYIAQRRRAALALAQSEERLRSIIDHTDAGYFFVELSGKLITVNRAWLKLYGYERLDDVCGKNFMDLQPEDDIETAREIVRGILRGETRYQTGLSSRKMKSGEIGYHSYSARAVWRDGRVQGIEGFLIDSTELKKTQDALVLSEQKFRSLFDCMSEGVALHAIIHDEQGQPVDYRILDINPAYERHAGIRMDQVAGKLATVAYHTDPPPYLEIYSRVVRTGKPASFETFYAPLDKHFHISAFSPGPGQFATVFTDITERKMMEAALAAEKQRLFVTIQSIGDGVIATDMDARVTLMNGVAEELTGWTGMEARGMPLDDVFQIIHEKTRQPCENPVKKVLREGRIVGLANHTALIARDGTERVIDDSAAPIRDPDGRIIGVVLVFRDSTAKKQLEGALRQAERLESIGILAGGLAHDFNNLLSGIYGYLEVLRDAADRGDMSKTLSIVPRVFDTFERAKGLTLQLLTFAKGGTPVRRRVCVSDLVRQAVSSHLSHDGIEVDLDIPEESLTCDCDEKQILQVFSHVLTNAVQAMPDGGRLTIRLSLVHRNDLPEGLGMLDAIVIRIRDTGVGIASKHMKHLFDPFFTAAHRGKAQSQGLGLATSYSIMKRHGGHIDVLSEEGAGTEVRLYLPLSEAMDTAASADSISERLPKRESRLILVMDDEKFILDVACAMLKARGYEAHTAQNGDEAIGKVREALAQGKAYAAAILDLTVPGGKGGRETVSGLREADPNLIIIASSGYSDDPVMAGPKSFGFDGSLTKPYRLEDLHAVLENLL